MLKNKKVIIILIVAVIIIFDLILFVLFLNKRVETKEVSNRLPEKEIMADNSTDNEEAGDMDIFNSDKTCQSAKYKKSDPEIDNFLETIMKEKISKDDSLLEGVAEYYGCKTYLGPNTRLLKKAKNYIKSLDVDSDKKENYLIYLDNNYNSYIVKDDNFREYNGEKLNYNSVISFDTLFGDSAYLDSAEFLAECKAYSDKVLLENPDPTGEINVKNDVLCDIWPEIVRKSLENRKFFKDSVTGIKGWRKDAEGNIFFVDKKAPGEKASVESLNGWRGMLRIVLAYRIGGENEAYNLCGNFSEEELFECNSAISGQISLFRKYQKCNCKLSSLY